MDPQNTVFPSLASWGFHSWALVSGHCMKMFLQNDCFIFQAQLNSRNMKGRVCSVPETQIPLLKGPWDIVYSWWTVPFEVGSVRVKVCFQSSVCDTTSIYKVFSLAIWIVVILEHIFGVHLSLGWSVYFIFWEGMTLQWRVRFLRTCFDVKGRMNLALDPFTNLIFWFICMFVYCVDAWFTQSLFICLFMCWLSVQCFHSVWCQEGSL